uniref:Uncharacterized protein n=1 Tax=Romanomermis culicivorax TaxID=13658 RepID=A0A915KMU1_ROMCU
MANLTDDRKYLLRVDPVNSSALKNPTSPDKSQLSLAKNVNSLNRSLLDRSKMSGSKFLLGKILISLLPFSKRNWPMHFSKRTGIADISCDPKHK